MGAHEIRHVEIKLQFDKKGERSGKKHSTRLGQDRAQGMAGDGDLGVTDTRQAVALDLRR